MRFEGICAGGAVCVAMMAAAGADGAEFGIGGHLRAGIVTGVPLVEAPTSFPCPPPSYPPYHRWRCPPPYYVPPLFVPSESIYGPQPVRRFMGLAPTPGRTARQLIVVEDEDDNEPDEADRLRQQRATNDQAVELGWKFIGFGDAHFQDQRYSQAYSRYKKASQAAPRLADAHFRQGFALVANGSYELAVKAFQRGFQLEPDWPQSDFRLDELYGANRLAKAAHVNALAQAAAADPQNADLLFLVGVHLYFDGQPARARPMFERAAKLDRGEHSQSSGFLDALGPAEM